MPGLQVKDIVGVRGRWAGRWAGQKVVLSLSGSVAGKQGICFSTQVSMTVLGLADGEVMNEVF